MKLFLKWFLPVAVVAAGLVCAWCSCVPRDCSRLPCADHLACEDCPKHCPLCEETSAPTMAAELTADANTSCACSVRSKRFVMNARMPDTTPMS